MATLYITEFGGLGLAAHSWGAQGFAQAAEVPPKAEQTVALSSTSAASAAFNAKTNIVRLMTDTNCFIEWGVAPTATTSSMPLTAGIAEYFSVPPGASYEVAGITA